MKSQHQNSFHLKRYFCILTCPSSCSLASVCWATFDNAAANASAFSWGRFSFNSILYSCNFSSVSAFAANISPSVTFKAFRRAVERSDLNGLFNAVLSDPSWEVAADSSWTNMPMSPICQRSIQPLQIDDFTHEKGCLKYYESFIFILRRTSCRHFGQHIYSFISLFLWQFVFQLRFNYLQISVGKIVRCFVCIYCHILPSIAW